MIQKNEYDTKKFLESNGISIPRGAMAKNANEARNIAASIGGYVVMKIVSKDIIHKSDGGFVFLNVDYRNAVNIYDELIIKAEKVNAKVDGVLVEEMLSGIEVFIGLKMDPQFGQIIVTGIGGIFLEVYKDISYRIAPITVDDAREMLKELKGYKILTGIRGKEPADINEITDVIVKVSNLKNVVEMDVNPLIVNSTSAIVADARMLIL